MRTSKLHALFNRAPKIAPKVTALSYTYDDNAFPSTCILQEMFPEKMQEVFIPSRNLIFNQHGVFSRQAPRNGNNPIAEIQLSKEFADRLDDNKTVSAFSNDVEFQNALAMNDGQTLRRS